MISCIEISEKFQVNFQNSGGETPLHRATLNESGSDIDVARILIKHKAGEKYM
jgi:ankyrin repeat protein